MTLPTLLFAVVTAAQPNFAGTLASVNKGENTVSLIDLATGKEVAKLPTGPNPQEVVFTPDGKTAIVSNMGQGAVPGKTLTVIDVATKKVSQTIELGEHGAPHGLAILDSERVLATSHQSDHLVVVNHKTGKVEKAMPSGGKGTHLAVLSPDRKLAYAANVGSGTVTIVDLTTDRVRAVIPAGKRAEGISISPDGGMVAIGNMGEDSVTIIDTQQMEPVEILKGIPGPIRTFFSGDGKRLFVASAPSGRLVSFDIPGYKESGGSELKSEGGFKLWSGEVPMPMNFERLAGQKIFFSVVLNANEVLAIDEQTMKVVRRYPTGQLPDGIAVTTFKVSDSN